jgi:TPR repeat protein
MPPARPVALKNLPQRSLTPSEALARHRDGLAAERVGDELGALKAFHEAAEAGHGPAQAKLGEIYDRGNSAVARDYATALGWYQKAREQGVAVPKPHTFPAGR